MNNKNVNLTYLSELYQNGIIKKDTYEKILRDLREEKQKLVTIKSYYNNKYVSVYGELDELVAIKENVGLSDRFILIDIGNGDVIIQTQEGYYVRVNSESKVLAATAVDRLNASIFNLTYINPKEIALKDKNGNYVEVGKYEMLFATSTSQNEKTSFKIKEVTKVVNNNIVIISASEERFVSAIDGGGSYLAATEFNQTKNEEFSILQFLDESTVIKTVNGYYVRVKDDTVLIADTTNIEDATRFRGESIGDDTVIIKTLDENIVRVREIDKYLIADSKEVTESSKFYIYKSTRPV